jgi:hypothetical protein
MFDLGNITFKQKYKDGQSITHTIRGDSTLDEVVEAFEYFLKGAGFNFEGHLDIIEDDLLSVDDMDSPSDNISFENYNQYNLMSESLRKSAD